MGYIYFFRLKHTLSIDERAIPELGMALFVHSTKYILFHVEQFSEIMAAIIRTSLPVPSS